MPQFLAGDIIAWAGSGEVSELIEKFSGGLSHVAWVIDPSIPVDGQPQTETCIFESTVTPGHSGPQINRLSAAQATYPTGSRSWKLSMADHIRGFLDWPTLLDVMTRMLHGVSYNYLELGEYVLRDLPFISYLPQIREANSHEAVCSEALADLLRAGGLPGLNPPLISPAIFASLRIYSGIEQLTGPPASIRGFSTF
jgi:hypothetical protein